MTGEHVIPDEAAVLSPGAKEGTAADPQLEADLARLALIRRLRANHTTWHRIGLQLGMTGPQAKHHHKRLTAETRRAWYLAQTQPPAPPEPEPSPGTEFWHGAVEREGVKLIPARPRRKNNRKS